ncbi:MAG: PH domain-containing protein [Armatimonadetes bacterium]|nr:PH domain-containing protein [Armatimonadota bacterium]
MKSFPISPGSGGAVAMVVMLALVMLGLMALIASFGWSAKHASFEVSRHGLRIAGAIYGRTIALKDLDTDGARVVDLRENPDLALVVRTNGCGMPGYAAGWFRTRSRQKALAFVTDPSHVACIPTRLGYTLMLSTPEPARLIDALRDASREDNMPPT